MSTRPHDTSVFESATQNFRKKNKNHLARLRRSRRPESKKHQVMATAKKEDDEPASEDVKVSTYKTSARQRFVRAFFRPWRWGHKILGLPSLRVPTIESESTMNKRTMRVMQWRRYCQREVDRGAVAPPPEFASNHHPGGEINSFVCPATTSPTHIHSPVPNWVSG